MTMFGALALVHAGPQPPTGTWRMVCLGDSITQGSASYRSYRYELWKRMIDEGIPVDFVGSLTTNFGGNPSFPNYAGQAFDRNHDGHWAWDTEDILNGYICNETQCPGVTGGQLSQWLNGYTPDLALIHLGVNDLFRGWPASRSYNNLSTIIDQLRSKNPNVVIFLSNLINTKLNEGSINSAIQTLAGAKNTAQSPVIFVDNYSGFSTSTDLQGDQTHPNTSGELKMANKFGDAIVEYLNFNSPPIIEAGANQTITWPQVTTTLNGQVSDDGEPDPPGVLSVEWVQLAGPSEAFIAHPQQAVTHVTFDAGGTYFFRLRVSDSEFTLNDYILVTVQDGGSCEGQSALVAGESDDWYLFKAKAYNGYTSGSGAGASISWGTVTEYHGISGDVVLQSLPFAGGSVGNTTTGARLDYPIYFTSSGLWYVWLRQYAADTHDSVHIGLNETAVSLAGNGVAPPSGTNGWVWQGHLSNQATRLAVNVPSRGLHRLNVWMHESGAAFEQILVTKNAALVPGASLPTMTSVTTYCDLDADAMPDAWEQSMFGSNVPMAGGDADGDFSLNLEEYIAGTGASDINDFPQLMTQPMGNTDMAVIVPSVLGRLYDIEFTENLSVPMPVWQLLESNLPGNGSALSVLHTNAPPMGAYRHQVRMAP